MQTSMPVDLRAEFGLRASTMQEQVRTSLDQLSTAVNLAVTAKFEQADAKFAEEPQDIRGIVTDLKTKWDMLQDGSVKELGDHLAAKEAEDMQLINQVDQIFRREILEIRGEMMARKPSIETNMTDFHLNMTTVRDQVKHHENAISTFLGAGGAGGPPGFGGGFGSPGFLPPRTWSDCVNGEVAD